MGCYNSIVINAPSLEVWGAFSNFHDLSWSKNVISKIDKVGSKYGDEIGAKRILNDAFHETLISLDHSRKVMTYSIDDGPEAVSKDNVKDYIGKVQVFDVSSDHSTFVLWTSEWMETKDNGIAAFCNPIYQALLQELKIHFS